MNVGPNYPEWEMRDTNSPFAAAAGTADEASKVNDRITLETEAAAKGI